MKKISVLVFIVFMALTFGVNKIVNCQAAEKENIKKDMGLSIGVSLSSLDEDGMLYTKNQFLELCNGTRDNNKDNNNNKETIKDNKDVNNKIINDGENMKIQVVNSNNNSKAQKNDIKSLVRSGINVLVVDPVEDDSKDIKEALNFAIANDVKVVLMNSKVKGYGERTSYVGFNDYSSGVAVKDKVFSDFYKKGVKDSINVIVLKENENSDVKSFVKGITENGTSKVSVLGEYVLDDIDENDVMDTLEEAMSTFEKVDAVICSNDYIANLCEKVAARNELNIAITGQDADLSACSRIMKGKQVCTVYKPYDKLVSEVLRLCYNLYYNKENESISIDTVMVDGRNMFPVIVGNQFHQAKDIFAY